MRLFFRSKWAEIAKVDGKEVIKWFARTYVNPEKDRRTGTQKKYDKKLNILAMKLKKS